jgi:allantoin racemase
MKILVINPNTSEFVTRAVAAEAVRAASSGTEIEAVTGRKGAAIVSGRAENAIAAVEAMELAVEHSAGMDGIILAVSFDSGLPALRELLPIPVVGMSEAAMLTACMLGGRFSLVTFGNRAVPLYEELCNSYGLSSRLAGVLSLPPLSPDEMQNPILVVPKLAELIEEAVMTQRTEAVILAGAIFANISKEVATAVSVPVVNGITAAVGMVEALVRLGASKPRAGSYQLPAGKEVREVSPALATYFGKLP